MQLYIFVIITVLLMVKPTVNALFLSKLGAENLPYGYLLVAVVAVATSYFYTRFVKRHSLLKITISTLVIFSISFLILAALLQFSTLSEFSLFGYYLGVALFAVISTSQFWVLANMVFNAREAKRLFGFIGAGAIAGGIFGGYLTSIIASEFGKQYVVFSSSLLLLCCIPILIRIWKLRVNKLNVYVRSQRKESDNFFENSSLKIIFKSKHLTYLALITGISVIVAKLIDFQFSDFANKAILDSDKLTSFFGFWFSSFNVVALCTQLFWTNKILSRVGVASTLLILPFSIALGCLLFLTFPELWVLVIIKGFDGSFKQSINKAAIELSIMPIPLDIKNQAKSYIDVAVDSIATGFAGLLLLFLVRKLQLSSSYVTVIILFFVFIWILLIYKLREAYFNSFRSNIQNILNESGNLDFQKKREKTVTVARKILKQGNEDEILKLLEYTGSSKINALKHDIIRLLKHPSSKVKAAAINQFYLFDKGTALDDVKKLVHDTDDNLVLTALTYLLNHSSFGKYEFFQLYLNHKNQSISDAALLCLARETSSNDKLAKLFNLDDRIRSRITTLGFTDINNLEKDIAKLLITIAETGNPEYYTFIYKHLESENQYIVKHAIKAAGITAESEFLPKLFELGIEKNLRKATIKALRRYGTKIIDHILILIKNDNLPNNLALLTPKIIGSFKSQKAVSVLIKLLRSKDVNIRLEASKVLNTLSIKSSELNLNKRVLKKHIHRESKFYKRTWSAIASLKFIIEETSSTSEISDFDRELIKARQKILDILFVQAETSFTCIFNLLSIIYDQSDIKITYTALKTKHQDARLNALEFLDNLLQNELKQIILPLVEHYVLDPSKLENSDIELQIMAEIDCLLMLARNRGNRIKLEVLYLIALHRTPKYKRIVRRLKKHPNQKVRQLAMETLESIQLKNVG